MEVAPPRELKLFNERIKAMNEIAFSPDGKTILAADKDKTIKLFDLASEQELKTLTGKPAGDVAFTFSPDEKILAGSGEEIIKLWNVKTGAELRSFQLDRKPLSSSSPTSFSPDGTMLIVGGTKVIKVWSVITGEEFEIPRRANSSVQREIVT